MNPVYQPKRQVIPSRCFLIWEDAAAIPLETGRYNLYAHSLQNSPTRVVLLFRDDLFTMSRWEVNRYGLTLDLQTRAFSTEREEEP